MKTQFTKWSMVVALVIGSLLNAQNLKNDKGRIGVNITPRATFDVQTSAENLTNTSDTNEGIIPPAISKTRLAQIADNRLVGGTVVYINEYSNYTGSNAKVSEVDSKDLYIYNESEQKWKKLGGNNGAAKLQELTGGIRKVSQTNASEWAEPGTFCLIQTGGAAIQLPAPANYKNKIISVNNQSGGNVSYAEPSPRNRSALNAGHGHLLMSDGKAWYIIGGGY